jgi:hypothetical protein
LLALGNSLEYLYPSIIVHSISGGYTTICINKLIFSWFGDNEKVFVLSLLETGGLISKFSTFIMPVLFVNDNPNHLLHPEKDRQDYLTFLAVQASIVTVLLIPSLLGLIKNRPKTPPSATAPKI